MQDQTVPAIYLYPAKKQSFEQRTKFVAKNSNKIDQGELMRFIENNSAIKLNLPKKQMKEFENQKIGVGSKTKKAKSDL